MGDGRWAIGKKRKRVLQSLDPVLRMADGGWRMAEGGWRKASLGPFWLELELEPEPTLAGGWRLEAGGWRLETGDSSPIASFRVTPN